MEATAAGGTAWLSVGGHCITTCALHPTYIACPITPDTATLLCFVGTANETAKHDQRQQTAHDLFHSNPILNLYSGDRRGQSVTYADTPFLVSAE